MTSTFPWIPDQGATLDETPSVRSVRFGDGYSQDAPNGLNPIMQKRNVSFSGRSLPETDAIIAFLRARGGTERFFYTHPRDIQRLWKCSSWKQADGDSTSPITATFEEVPL